MQTRVLVLDGGHEYGVWDPGLSSQLDWLGIRLWNRWVGDRNRSRH